jgi:hypothetical protein
MATKKKGKKESRDENGEPKFKKHPCPITRGFFKKHAKSVRVSINGMEKDIPVKFFSTGSLGWYFSGKIDIDVGGKMVPVQAGISFPIANSKELPEEDEDEEEDTEDETEDEEEDDDDDEE